MYNIIYDSENDKIVNSKSKRGIEILNSYNDTLYGGVSLSDEEENEKKLSKGRLRLEKNLLESFDNEENVEQFKKLLNSTNSLLAGGFLVRSYSNDDLEIGDLDIYVQNKHAVSMLLYLNSVGFEMNFWNMAPPYDQSFFRKNNIMSRTFLTKNNYEKKDSSKEWKEGDTILVSGFWMAHSRIKLGRDYKPRYLPRPRKAVIKKNIRDDIYKISWVDKNIEDTIVYEKDISPLIKITCDLMIIPDFIDPKQIVQNFDLTFCEIWFDGKTVDATDINGVLNKKGFLRKEYTDSLLTKFNKFLIDRIRKYSKKGFNITINPDQESYDIDTHEIENLNKAKGYRYPKVESYESWFVTQVYKALICTRGRWKFKLSPTGAEIVINYENEDVNMTVGEKRNRIKMKNNLINWLWMVQHPLEKRTIDNLVEISKKTNEIDTIAKLYDENYVSDDNYFYYSNVLTPIQKYWFILLHFNAGYPYDDDFKEFDEITCSTSDLSNYGNLLEKHSFLKTDIQIKKRINNRKIIENHEIIPRILPSLYTKEIAKHTNINWSYKESVLRVFYNDDGDFEPDIELLFNAFSFVNDNKYKDYSTYLKKINIFLDHPLNYIYNDDPNLYNFWQKQEVIESLNILNIDESIYNTCFDLLEIKENVELQKSQEIIDLEKIMIELNKERMKAIMFDKDIPKFNELENKRQELKSQLDVLEEELQKDSINPRHRYIDSWRDVDEQFVIIIGGEPICYSISKIMDMTKDYKRWLFECTGILQRIEEGKSEEKERGDNEIRYKYNRFWHPPTPSVPFTHVGNILYAGIVTNDDGFLVYVNVNELRSMILHIVNDGIKVFHFTDEKSLTHTVNFDGVYDPYFNQVSQNHCQHGSNIMTYNIKICYGKKCLPKKLLGYTPEVTKHDLFMNHPFKRVTEINPPVIEKNEVYSEKELFLVPNEI